MIYAEHDFTQNFCNAIGYEDSFMLKDIIIDEIARQIVENKKDVVGLLRKQNINVSIRDNNQIISNAVINEISKGNDEVTKGISNMISLNRFDDTKYKNILGFGKKKASSPTEQKKKGAFLSKLKTLSKNENVQEGVAGLLAYGIKKTFDKKKASSKEVDENKANLDERLKINQSKNTKEKFNWGKIVLIGGIAIVISGLLIYAIKKSRQTE